MARKAVVDAVMERLGPVVDEVRRWQPASGDAVPVIGPNETGDADPAGSNFISVQFPVANETQISTGAPGNNVWREEEVCRLLINVERNSGLDHSSTWAEELSALFRGTSFDNGNGQFWSVTSPQMDDRNEESGWYRAPIAIAYDHDLYG